MSTDFSDKLKLVLKFLVVSRSGLASALNVDKSLVGRWAAGTVRPSEHNRAKITRYVAERVPGFTLLDWERDIEDLKKILGVETAEPVQAGYDSIQDFWIPPNMLEEARRSTKSRGSDYEGIWKSTRASNDLPGRFVHDICMVRQRDDGLLQFRVGVEGVRYNGWSIMLQHQLFSFAADEEASTMMFSIFNGVARQRPQILDGVNLATLRDAAGSPVASASVLQRVSDLSGEEAADLALFEKTIAELNPLAPEDSIPDAIVEHLTKGVIDGAPGIFRLLFGRSMARGMSLEDFIAAQ